MIWEGIKSLFGGLVNKLPGEIIDYYKTKRELKHEYKLTKLRGKIAIREAKDERKAKAQLHTQNWEMTYVQLQATSWKDELVLLVLIYPFVGVFIPVIQDSVLVGFEYLAKVPAWWVAITAALMLAIYGIRHNKANKINIPGLSKQPE